MLVPYITSDDAWMAASATRYWSDTRLVFEPGDDDTVHAVVVHEYDDSGEGSGFSNPPITLTLADLNDAAERTVRDRLCAAYILGYIAQRDIDAAALDVVIQIAALDDVRYG